MNLAGKVVATVRITNTGKRPGAEVLQLYVRDLVASMTRPVREMKAFERIELDAGESREVRFAVPVQNLGFFDSEMNYVVEPGKFKLWIGPSSVDGLETEFEIIAEK